MAKQHMVTSPVAQGGKVKVASVMAACVACMLGATAVHAEEDIIPLYLTMSQELEHDNNLLRDNDTRVGAVVSTTKARVGLDKTYGRQHYQLDATLAKNRYMRNESYDVGRFDNDSHTVNGSFTTDIASDFRLNLNGKSLRNLPSFEDSLINRQARNVVRTKIYGADLRYGLHGRMSVNTGFSKSSVKYDQTRYDDREATSTFVGLRYLPNELMYFGLTYTRSDTEYPRREVQYPNPSGGTLLNRVGEDVQTDNLSLNALWQVTGFSRFSGSLGYSDEKYTYDTRRDFNGVTGGASWKFTPSGKITYQLSWNRDTNNSGGYSKNYGVDVGNIFFVTGSGYRAVSRVTNSYSASATYEATSKLSFGLTYSLIKYEEELTDVQNKGGDASASQDGRYNGYSLNGDYQALDSLAFGCSATFYDRTKSLFQKAFDGRSLSCYAAFTLQ